MKKFTKVLALVLVTVFAALSMVACAPNSDPEKAEKALKDKDYTVVRVSDGSASIAGMKIDASNYLNALGAEDKSDLTAVVYGVKGLIGGENITILYFKDSATAKEYWDKAQEQYGKDDSDKDSDYVIKRSGKMIYFGTKAAVKAAR